VENLVSILVDFGIVGIMITAFSEAIFLPVPMELVSIPIYLLNPTRAFFYSAVLIIFSMLGSITGYHLSRIFGKPLMNKLVSAGNFNRLKTLYHKNSFLTILTSSFTPIPYEVYVLSAGVLNIGFRKFIFASIISRIIRHVPQGILITLYGDTLLAHLKNYTLIICLIIFIILLFSKYLLKKNFIN